MIIRSQGIDDLLVSIRMQELHVGINVLLGFLRKDVRAIANDDGNLMLKDGQHIGDKDLRMRIRWTGL